MYCLIKQYPNISAKKTYEFSICSGSCYIANANRTLVYKECKIIIGRASLPGERAFLNNPSFRDEKVHGIISGLSPADSNL